jgi:DNA-directed RNA polymerase subunit RPC12/RpoP
VSSNWKNYQGKILKRCSLCGKFSARYRVEDSQLGSLILCQNCWSRRAAAKNRTDEDQSPTEEKRDEHSGQS